MHVQAMRPPTRITPMTMSDVGFVGAAALLLAAAGSLQYSLSSGEQGINAFLMKEKDQNPFYSKSFLPEKRIPPRWLSAIRLPRLDFVEVYGQEDSSRSRSDSDKEVDFLYDQMDAAIELEQYAKAAQIKTRIDHLLSNAE